MEAPLPKLESYSINNNGVDLIPSSSQLFTLERNICNVDFRERILKTYVDTIRERYDAIIIDTMPQIGTPMMNVLLSVDSIVIPTQAELLSAVGMTELANKFAIGGHDCKRIAKQCVYMLFEMLETSCRTHFAEQNEFSQVRMFNTKIPRSVKVGEASLYGKNICEYICKPICEQMGIPPLSASPMKMLPAPTVVGTGSMMSE